MWMTFYHILVKLDSQYQNYKKAGWVFDEFLETTDANIKLVRGEIKKLEDKRETAWKDAL